MNTCDIILQVQVNTMLSAGQGREAALAAALLNDPNLMEKSWLDTGMFAEAALHAHVSNYILTNLSCNYVLTFAHLRTSTLEE